MDETDLSENGKELIAALTEFRDALRSGEPLETKFTVRTVARSLAPRTYAPDDVKQTRESLNLSQALFARLLGAGVNTVRSWENGSKPPAPIACRFMDEINIAPDHWQRRVIQIFRPKVRRLIPAPREGEV